MPRTLRFLKALGMYLGLAALGAVAFVGLSAILVSYPYRALLIFAVSVASVAAWNDSSEDPC